MFVNVSVYLYVCPSISPCLKQYSLMTVMSCFNFVDDAHDSDVIGCILFTQANIKTQNGSKSVVYICLVSSVGELIMLMFIVVILILACFQGGERGEIFLLTED